MRSCESAFRGLIRTPPILRSGQRGKVCTNGCQFRKFQPSENGPDPLSRSVSWERRCPSTATYFMTILELALHYQNGSPPPSDQVYYLASGRALFAVVALHSSRGYFCFQ